uniref:Uncharacterized protein n=1 Tax=Romanomermis culicivorax TaxID=13658 RepID=A0A915IMW2_ROMCU
MLLQPMRIKIFNLPIWATKQCGQNCRFESHKDHFELVFDQSNMANSINMINENSISITNL